MAIVDDACVAIRLADEECVIDDIGRVVRIRIRLPFEITETSAIRRIFAAVIGAGGERFLDEVRQEDHGTVRRAMRSGGCDRRLQITERRHVADGIVHEHVIEDAIQAQCAHVADEEFRFGIDRAILREHAFGDIRQCQCKLVLEMRRQAAATRAKLEQRL